LENLQEGEYYPASMEDYEACLNATNPLHAPWYVVPADDKENARLIIFQVIVETFEDLKMQYPGADKAARQNANP